MRIQRYPDVKAFALAGGGGTRLLPLTAKRAKPAVPFGGKWTIFDLVMWSLYWSGFRDIGVLVQRNAVSLTDHVGAVWPRKPNGGAYFQVLPPEGFEGRHEYRGTADAVYQHLHYAEDREHVLIVSGDHLYKVDFGKFVQFHAEQNADLTIMAITVPLIEASAFGVIGADSDGRIKTFKEKPKHPTSIPDNPGFAYCSMGVYMFKREVLHEYLVDDATQELSSHDFGKDIIPRFMRDKRAVFAYPFSENVAPGQKVAYWRDVGTLDAYHQEHMNLCDDDPVLNLFTEQWPVTTVHDRTPPAKFANRAVLDHTHVSGGCIIDASELRYAVLGRKVIVRSGCSISESIIFGQVHVENGCTIRRTIIDVDPALHDNQRVVVPSGTIIGVNREEDEERGFTITESGITVVPYTWFKDGRTIRSD